MQVLKHLSQKKKKAGILNMKGYRIAFIRHGMTQANLDGRYIGTTDLPLCREGADQLYEKIEKYDYPSVQKVYTSPLKRCKQTISILQPNRLVAEMPSFVKWTSASLRTRPLTSL